MIAPICLLVYLAHALIRFELADIGGRALCDQLHTGGCQVPSPTGSIEGGVGLGT